MTHRVFLKICCIKTAQEASLAWQVGAHVLGFVAPMPSGPGTLLESEIARIVPIVPPPVATFLLTPKQAARDIVAQHRVCRTSHLQLVDDVPVSELIKLREALPGIGLVQVIHVCSEVSIAQALLIAPYVNAVLLDSGNQKLAVKELGGTGRTHDWRISRRIRDALLALPEPKPVFLAGGLSAGNVRAAIAEVQPHGIDVCSGVRTNDQLDAEKLSLFMAALQGDDTVIRG